MKKPPYFCYYIVDFFNFLKGKFLATAFYKKKVWVFITTIRAYYTLRDLYYLGYKIKFRKYINKILYEYFSIGNPPQPEVPEKPRAPLTVEELSDYAKEKKVLEKWMDDYLTPEAGAVKGKDKLHFCEATMQILARFVNDIKLKLFTVLSFFKNFFK